MVGLLCLSLFVHIRTDEPINAHDSDLHNQGKTIVSMLWFLDTIIDKRDNIRCPLPSAIIDNLAVLVFRHGLMSPQAARLTARSGIGFLPTASCVLGCKPYSRHFTCIDEGCPTTGLNHRRCSDILASIKMIPLDFLHLKGQVMSVYVNECGIAQSLLDGFAFRKARDYVKGAPRRANKELGRLEAQSRLAF